MDRNLTNRLGAKGFMFLFSFGGIVMSVFYMFVVIVAAYLVYKTFTFKSADKEADDAQRILRERYAKGELTEEEYDKMKSKLNKK